MKRNKIRNYAYVISFIFYGTLLEEMIDDSFLRESPKLIYIGVRIIIFLALLYITVSVVLLIHSLIENKKK